jgi:hypothetical protein
MMTNRVTVFAGRLIANEALRQRVVAVARSVEAQWRGLEPSATVSVSLRGWGSAPADHEAAVVVGGVVFDLSRARDVFANRRLAYYVLSVGESVVVRFNLADQDQSQHGTYVWTIYDANQQVQGRPLSGNRSFKLRLPRQGLMLPTSASAGHGDAFTCNGRGLRLPTSLTNRHAHSQRPLVLVFTQGNDGSLSMTDLHGTTGKIASPITVSDALLDAEVAWWGDFHVPAPPPPPDAQPHGWSGWKTAELGTTDHYDGKSAVRFISGQVHAEVSVDHPDTDESQQVTFKGQLPPEWHLPTNLDTNAPPGQSLFDNAEPANSELSIWDGAGQFGAHAMAAQFAAAHERFLAATQGQNTAEVAAAVQRVTALVLSFERIYAHPSAHGGWSHTLTLLRQLTTRLDAQTQALR